MPPKRSNSAQLSKFSAAELDVFNELSKWAAKPKYRKVADPQELFALFVGNEAWRIPISRLRDTEVKALLALHNGVPKAGDPMWTAIKGRLAADLKEFRVADPKSQFVNNAQVVVEIVKIREVDPWQVPAMVCCNRTMSQSTLWTGVFHCSECKSAITVDNPREYDQCELCGCFYHQNFINNVTHVVEKSATDVSIHLHCNGCMQREYAEEDDGEDPLSPAK
jgi:hypothetical protein